MKPVQPDQPHFQPGRHLEVLDDPSHDPYQAREKLSEPSVCRDCGAVYHQGRWQWIHGPRRRGPGQMRRLLENS